MAAEISFTGEGDWYPAELQSPQSAYSWQNWSFPWDATDVGRHTIRARATDAAGNVQPEIPPWSRLGYGNNAIEVPYVDVFLTRSRHGHLGQSAACPTSHP